LEKNWNDGLFTYPFNHLTINPCLCLRRTAPAGAAPKAGAPMGIHPDSSGLDNPDQSGNFMLQRTIPTIWI
jgi:hypothetical protein